MNKSPSERLSRTIAREVCQRSNSAVYLAGVISNSNGGFDIEVNAMACATDKVVATSAGQARDRDAAIPTLGEIGKQMRNRLGESLPSIARFNKNLPSATTSSLEALQAYSAGLSASQFKGPAEELPYYQRATTIDPNFASAFNALGIAYLNLHQRVAAIENLRKAFDLRQRVSERERLNIETVYYQSVTGETAQGIRTCEDWVRLYPNDNVPLIRLGLYYFRSGDYEKAAASFREAQVLAPDSVSTYANLGAAYLV